jgi:D-alanyl-D-alanine carboxypeptidase/D-alanyl-D-alanine-endopeptidase (penicillin-binding protein 4)
LIRALPPAGRTVRCLGPTLILLLAGAVHAADTAERGAPAPLPASVAAALEQAGVADAASAFVVVPLDGGTLRLSHHADTPMNPASTMKLLTTYVALASLGSNYRWHTEALAAGPVVGGRLEGDLVVRGGGDPSLVIERWWLLVQRLRALGIREIRGDLVLDRSRYAPVADGGATLDGNELRPYNVAPDALLINFKAVALTFVPERGAATARIAPMPPLDGFKPPATVRLSDGPCGDWHARLKADFAHPRAPVFRGSYPRACGEKTWYLSLLGPDEYALASFRALWHAAGGVFRGTARTGVAGAGAQLLVDQESPPLAEVIRDINKNSNNVMARQLFLTLGAPLPEAPRSGTAQPAEGLAHDGGEPASIARSIARVQAWLAEQGLAMPELVLENGSGLSRQERVSAASLARLLALAWNGSEMPNFLASLPVAGVDGTMKDRRGAAGSAYVKTGSLAEVRALAGYVFAASGRRYAVVALINDPHAEAAQAAHDAFLEWVWKEG